MCLEVIDSANKTRKLKNSLPEWLPVWKIIKKNNEPEYGGEHLNRKKTLKAKNVKEGRLPARRYKPGFHAFLDEEEARKAFGGFSKYRINLYGLSVRIFWAKPEWITASGQSNCVYSYAQTVVLKKIRRK